MREPRRHETTGLPAHPRSIDRGDAAAGGSRWGSVLVVALLVGLLVLVIVLHLTGLVGPGAH